jgi:hypothetical protein
LSIKHAKILLSGYECEEYKRLDWGKIIIPKKTQDGNRKPKSVIEVLWKNYKECENGKVETFDKCDKCDIKSTKNNLTCSLNDVNDVRSV